MTTTYLNRSAWTTTPNGRAGRPLKASRVLGIALHWPTGKAPVLNASREKVAELLRGYRAGHLEKKWADIGYNFAVDGSGRVWDLTGFNIGAHAGTAGNPTRVGIVLILSENETPNAAMISAVRDLRGRVLVRYPNATGIAGHRQIPGNSTACPGPYVLRLIADGTFLSKATAPTKPTVPASRLGSSGFIVNCASRHARWTTRVHTLASQILGSDASIIYCLELYAERRGALTRLIGHRYVFAGVSKGRVVYVRKDRWKAVAGTDRRTVLGRAKKAIVGVKIQHVATGKRLNPIAVHLTYQLDRGAYRKEEARQIVPWALKNFPSNRLIIAGDFNTPAKARGRVDDVGQIMAAAGYRDVAEKTTTPPEYRLLRMFVGASVDVDRVRTFANTGSDHRTVLVEFNVPL
ncbi:MULTISPECIES: N-acetylmuramoyl-L-alanine amidase [unclassified Aeromicrobium]|uniref:N-acetylmuramoyl-L-alanine amidase n=1 Tax=unclassified Aeromicrobium TaxID=2633570 RepID=UPI00288AE7D4|nr:MULTISPECIES: N-acetylmuramoyl-L-alanine amidase [unclassified Aeromicrobium]